IEIHDNGPIYTPTLPALRERDIVLRGGGGHRPLIVWETSAKAPQGKSATALCTLAEGKLVLDNLDFVTQWSDKAPAALFDLAGTDFRARDCTFSVAGESPRGEGVTLLRRSGAAPENRATQTWLQRCYARGADLSLLRERDASTALLLEDSLIVGYQQPLLDVRGGDQAALDLYCVRSSLIAGQMLLRCQADGKGSGPKIAVKVLDSILSRDDAAAPAGDMMHLGVGVDLAKASWRASNSVYSGWKHLLASDDKTLPGNEL